MKFADGPFHVLAVEACAVADLEETFGFVIEADSAVAPHLVKPRLVDSASSSLLLRNFFGTIAEVIKFGREESPMFFLIGGS